MPTNARQQIKIHQRSLQVKQYATIQSRYSQSENLEIIHRLVHGLNAPARLAHQERRRRRSPPSCGAAIPALGSRTVGSTFRTATPPGTSEETVPAERGKARDPRIGGERSRGLPRERLESLRKGTGGDDDTTRWGGDRPANGGGDRSVESSLPHSRNLCLARRRRSRRRSRGGEEKKYGVRTRRAILEVCRFYCSSATYFFFFFYSSSFLFQAAVRFCSRFLKVHSLITQISNGR